MGKVICVGLGPGDPDLMSVKSHRALQSAKQIAYFHKQGSRGQARQIVGDIIGSDAIEHKMTYPVTTEIHFGDDAYKTAMNRFYDEWAERIIELTQSDDLIVLCEGDPFFYGSYMHLYVRLEGRVEQDVIPAITGMSASWHATGIPMTWGDDVLTVLMGTLSEEKLVEHIESADAIAIMKTGKNLPKIASALKKAERFDDAYVVQYASMPNQNLMKLKDADLSKCPYFATVIVHGSRRER